MAGDRELIAVLAYGHADIVGKAVEWLRAASRETPDPGALLGEPFTLKDLRELHEVVAGTPLMWDTFLRFVEPKLAGTGLTSDGMGGRPSRLRGVDVIRAACPANAPRVKNGFGLERI